jgi:succinate dehydrogenase / fumarate reductase cytochrome b subunit
MSFSSFYRSDLGKKTVMAVTGIMLFGFVLGHMVGNLKIYMGPGVDGQPAPIDEYAHWLREVGHPALPDSAFLWIARIVLLAAVGLHAWSAWVLTRRSRRARPEKYERRNVAQATYASRTVRWGGVIIALFIFYHLAHLTTGQAHSDFRAGEVYQNVVSAFQSPLVSLVYIAAQLALGFHLYHGLWSMFQTLGWYNEGTPDWRRRFALVFALIVAIGNISFPVAVLTGLVS